MTKTLQSDLHNLDAPIETAYLPHLPPSHHPQSYKQLHQSDLTAPSIVQNAKYAYSGMIIIVFGLEIVLAIKIIDSFICSYFYNH